jgi:predicted lipase
MLLKYFGYDTRDCKVVNDFDANILPSIIASHLAYLHPDVFFDKWNKYKNIELVTLTDQSFYSIRENIINTFFYGVTQKPIYYDGCLNKDCTKDSKAYLVLKNDIAYITFRGTDDILNIATDLNGFLVNIKEDTDVKVHKGFYAQFTSIKEWILNDLKRIKPKKIIFTGHSMGSAIATIAAAIFALDKTLPEITCIGFGSPRTGDKNFKALYNTHVKNSYRITNTYDPVPLLPFLPYYEHVSPAYHIKDNKLYKQIGDLYWPFRFINFLYDMRKPIYNHAYDVYIQNILEIIKTI